MSIFKSPIEIAVNANCFLMEGMHGVLGLRFRNTAVDEHFKIQALLRSRLFSEPHSINLTLNSGADKRRRIEFYLPKAGEGQLGSAGPALFEVEFSVDAGEDGHHRFTGDFVLPVLAHADTRQQFNINIEKLVEMSGDKAGMGAVTDINLKLLENLPEHKSVNQLITEKREANFVPIDLEYEGEVPDTPPPILVRAGEPLTRCTLVDRETGSRLLVLTGDTITLGCSREKADIVTWLMPRNEENDYESRKISRQHCRLSRYPDGVYIEHLSQTNLTKLDGESVRGKKLLGVGPARSLRLSPGFELKVTVLPPAPVDRDVLQSWQDAAGPVFSHAVHWSQQTGVGGVLIERTDELAEQERYLWVIAPVDMFEASAWSSCVSGLIAAIAVLPGIGLNSLPGRAQLQINGDGFSARTLPLISLGDVIACGTCSARVEHFAQAHVHETTINSSP